MAQPLRVEHAGARCISCRVLSETGLSAKRECRSAWLRRTVMTQDRFLHRRKQRPHLHKHRHIRRAPGHHKSPCGGRLSQAEKSCAPVTRCSANCSDCWIRCGSTPSSKGSWPDFLKSGLDAPRIAAAGAPADCRRKLHKKVATPAVDDEKSPVGQVPST